MSGLQGFLFINLIKYKHIYFNFLLMFVGYYSTGERPSGEFSGGAFGREKAFHVYRK